MYFYIDTLATYFSINIKSIQNTAFFTKNLKARDKKKCKNASLAKLYVNTLSSNKNKELPNTNAPKYHFIEGVFYALRGLSRP